MKAVRPYIAACTASGVRMNDDVLAQMIQSQDKLAEIFGRKRTTVSIGIYELDRIMFPVEYRLAEPSSCLFTPLGMEEKLTLAEILERHPKGIAYGGIVKPFPQYPVLMDSMGHVLSFPPIINSREIGEVKPQTRNVLIEVTGTDLRMTMLTLNILAASFYDRGAEIEPVIVTYPYSTEFGKVVAFPVDTVREIQSSSCNILGRARRGCRVDRRQKAPRIIRPYRVCRPRAGHGRGCAVPGRHHAPHGPRGRLRDQPGL